MPSGVCPRWNARITSSSSTRLLPTRKTPGGSSYKGIGSVSGCCCSRTVMIHSSDRLLPVWLFYLKSGREGHPPGSASGAVGSRRAPESAGAAACNGFEQAEEFALVAIGVEPHRLLAGQRGGELVRMGFHPTQGVDQRVGRLLVEKDAAADSLLIGGDHRFGDSATSVGHDRRAAGLGLDRHDAKIFLAGENECPAAP